MVRSRAKFQYPPAFLALVEAAGYQSVHALALAVGNPDALRNFARGKSRTIRADNLQAIADRLGRSMDDVSAALGLPSGGRQAATGATNVERLPVRNSALLPVRYAVQAGAWIEVDNMAQARVQSPPVAADGRYPASAQWLELVQGDSANLFFPEGSFVHVVDAVAIGYSPRDDDFVVVERKREQGGLIERSLKQITIRKRKVELWPRSRNPRWTKPLDLNESANEDTMIEIAALVLGGYFPAPR